MPVLPVIRAETDRGDESWALSVDTDGAGDGVYTTLLQEAPETDASIAATATSNVGDTSEFSACVEATLFVDGIE